MELEGLRVVAAVLVVFFHASLMFYPSHFYGLGSADALTQNMRFEDNIYNSPFAGLLSGTFAVGIFFVLSGFVLSIGYFTKKDQQIVKRLASSRYLRLMIPAFVSVMIAWFCVATGLSNHLASVIASSHSGWLGHTWSFAPDFFDALYQGTIGIFVSQNVHYNPVLWTINVEMIGSFIVFGTLLLFANSKHRWIVYALLIIFTAKTWLLGFVIGMGLADLYANRKLTAKFLESKFVYILPVVAVILGGFPATEATNPIYKALLIPGFFYEQNRSLIITVGAALLVLSVLVIPRINAFFAHRAISGFGKYTYSLYLVHLPVLLTVGAIAFVLAEPIGFNKAVAIAVVAAWAVLIPMTYLFEKYVDAPSIRLAKHATEFYMSDRNIAYQVLLRRTARRFAKNIKKLRTGYVRTIPNQESAD